MDLGRTMLSEISQTEKDKYRVISLTWNLKNKMNKQNKQTPRHREQTDSCQAEGEFGEWVKMVQAFSIHWQFHSPRDVKGSVGDMVNNVIITMCGGRWVLDLVG